MFLITLQSINCSNDAKKSSKSSSGAPRSPRKRSATELRSQSKDYFSMEMASPRKRANSSSDPVSSASMNNIKWDDADFSGMMLNFTDIGGSGGDLFNRSNYGGTPFYPATSTSGHNYLNFNNHSLASTTAGVRAPSPDIAGLMNDFSSTISHGGNIGHIYLDNRNAKSQSQT